MLPFRSLISADQLTPAVLTEIFTVADQMQEICRKRGRSPLLASKIVALLFYEPSSRTMLSFQSAAERLYAGVLFAQGKEDSSFKKGETVQDSIRVISGYCDIIVMRHPLPGSAAQAAEVSSVPFINGGDGGNEHPTQAVIDAYTIWKEAGELSGLHFILGFDPLHSRSIHSLVRLLLHYSGVRFTFVSPPELRAPPSLLSLLKAKGISYTETDSLAEFKKADVCYLNRLQEERFTDRAVFEKYRRQFRLMPSMVADKPTLILDPLPRIDEIDEAVDALKQAAYFRQAHNGVPIRMALLALLVRGDQRL